jgi:hypothetical protein
MAVDIGTWHHVTFALAATSGGVGEDSMAAKLTS